MSMTTASEPLAKRERVSVLPLSCPPRGLSRPAAAEYIGVSVSKLDEMVADGRMPSPKRIDRRNVWDRLELDEMFSALPADNEENPWDVVT
jgi:predicted DNA-binding transcriptional regulator AlpA